MIWLRRISVILSALALAAIIAFIGFVAWVIFIEIALERGI